MVVDVPLGVEIINQDHNKLLARCSGNKQRYLLARGGKGGCADNDYRYLIKRKYLFSRLKLNINFRGI